MVLSLGEHQRVGHVGVGLWQKKVPRASAKQPESVLVLDEVRGELVDDESWQKKVLGVARVSVEHSESVPLLGEHLQAGHVDDELWQRKVEKQVTPPLLLSAGLDQHVAVLHAAP